ncbi:MAG: hypothetical protein D8H94_09195 [Cardiobacterium sp.]|jgi:lipoprotein|nr:MAG: hypothetical protein D8H94_09195 [Cardiobacterium sp.]
MKKPTIALALCTALLLTACGNNDKDRSDRLPSDPERPRINTRDYDSRQAYHGTAYSLPSQRARVDNRYLHALNSNQLDTLNLDGKSLPSHQAGIYTGGVPRLQARQTITVAGKSYQNFLISGDDYQNSRFGYLSHDGHDYIFSQGAFTRNMPNRGSARYEGEAVIGRDGSADVGKASFRADFGARTVSGRITPEDNSRVYFNPLNIDARIDGNAFYSDSDDRVSSSGHFYGDGAREIGGVFHDNSQNLRGSFGAIRK